MTPVASMEMRMFLWLRSIEQLQGGELANCEEYSQGIDGYALGIRLQQRT